MGSLLQRTNNCDGCQLELEIIFAVPLGSREQRRLKGMPSVAICWLADEELLLELSVAPWLVCHPTQSHAGLGDEAIDDF